MERVTIKKQVELSLTADDWSLYTESMDCNEAACMINQAISHTFNHGRNRKQVADAADFVMRECAHYGAHDTEPLWVLEQVLDELFGREE